jgi:hypothetical protein
MKLINFYSDDWILEAINIFIDPSINIGDVIKFVRLYKRIGYRDVCEYIGNILIKLEYEIKSN